MNTKEIYFAGGCFWGVEHFFKGVDGVTEAMPGYANGHIENPRYEQVYTDTTGFAETVRVRYRPDRVSLQELTRLFFRHHRPALGQSAGPRRRHPLPNRDLLHRSGRGGGHRPCFRRSGHEIGHENA